MNWKLARFRDRTLEFSSLVERVRLSQSLFGPRSKVSSKGETLSKSRPSQSKVALQTEFNKRASKVGYGIHQTWQKVAKLAKLANRTTSVFDDQTTEIQELTIVIKQEITALNAAIADLQLVCNAKNGNEIVSTDTITHRTTVVDNLTNRLMGPTKEFNKVLAMLRENLKVHESKRQLKQPHQSHIQSQQRQQLVPLLDSYGQSRAEALRKVESTIHELGIVYTQLATIVSQQGELAIRIDENMEDTLANVEGAQGQLMIYLHSISSNRWLIIKIFVVLFVFLMIFLFFVAD